MTSLRYVFDVDHVAKIRSELSPFSEKNLKNYRYLHFQPDNCPLKNNDGRLLQEYDLSDKILKSFRSVAKY